MAYKIRQLITNNTHFTQILVAPELLEELLKESVAFCCYKNNHAAGKNFHKNN